MTELVRDRLVPFEGAHNFRDLGGYPSHLGGIHPLGRAVPGRSGCTS